MSTVILDPDPARRRRHRTRGRKARARHVRAIVLDPAPARRRFVAKAKSLVKGHLSNVIVGFLGYKGFSNYAYDYAPSTSQKVVDFGNFSLQQNNIIGLAGSAATPILAGKKATWKSAVGGLVGGLLGYISDVYVTLKRQQSQQQTQTVQTPTTSQVSLIGFGHGAPIYTPPLTYGGGGGMVYGSFPKPIHYVVV